METKDNSFFLLFFKIVYVEIWLSSFTYFISFTCEVNYELFTSAGSEGKKKEWVRTVIQNNVVDTVVYFRAWAMQL